MVKHLKIGDEGENIAQEFLVKKGYRILDVNWRHRRAEIDIIAMDGDVLVFIEVKTRSSSLWGSPEEAISAKKERLMVDASGVYMEKIGHEWEVRFDIVTVLLLSDSFHEVNHFEDAFFPGIK